MCIRDRVCGFELFKCKYFDFLSQESLPQHFSTTVNGTLLDYQHNVFVISNLIFVNFHVLTQILSPADQGSNFSFNCCLWDVHVLLYKSEVGHIIVFVLLDDNTNLLTVLTFSLLHRIVVYSLEALQSTGHQRNSPCHGGPQVWRKQIYIALLSTL